MIKVINNYSSFVVDDDASSVGHFHVTLFIADQNTKKYISWNWVQLFGGSMQKT